MRQRVNRHQPLDSDRAWIDGLCSTMGFYSVVASHVETRRLAWTMRQFNRWRRCGLSQELATYRVLYG